MNKQNEKLTAEEMWLLSHQFAHLTQDRNIPSELLSDVHFVMEDYAAQQVEFATAELWKELEIYKELAKNNQVLFESSEELKKEAQRQKDSAVDIAHELLTQLKYVQKHFVQTGSTAGVITQCEVKLSRL